jgi:biotin carboxyl carrier protein
MLQVDINHKAVFEVDKQEGQWTINGNVVTADVCLLPNSLISILYNNRSYTALVEHMDVEGKEISLRIGGNLYRASIKEPIDMLLSSMGLDRNALQKAEPVKAPMPGMVLRVLVTPGQAIKKGDALLVLEAMKMENILKAQADGVVKSIKATERTAVEKGAILIELE